jgi:signal transduction histidine kinase
LLDAPALLLIGRGIDELLRCASPEEPWARRLKANGVASFEQPLRRCCQTIWIWWSVHWLGANGGPKEYQAVGRDMTALRRLRVEAARGAEEIQRNAVMRERLRIAHDLHDTLVQSLVALVPQLRLIRKVAGDGADPRLIDELARAEAAARDGLTHARAALADLRRRDVEPGGFGSALERLADLYSARTGVKLRLDIDTRARTASGERAEVLYRIASEALRNAELHADPTRVELTVLSDEFETLTLIVADDGRGFDAEQVQSGHFGLIGMQEQAEMIGASFSLVADGEFGTKVTVVAPAPDTESNGAA